MNLWYVMCVLFRCFIVVLYLSFCILPPLYCLAVLFVCCLFGEIKIDILDVCFNICFRCVICLDTPNVTHVRRTVGQEVIFICITPSIKSTDWWFQDAATGTASQISSAYLIINGFNTDGRFTLRRDISGDASLRVRNVSQSDNGVYICRIHLDDDIQYEFQLTVLRKYFLITLNANLA